MTKHKHKWAETIQRAGRNDEYPILYCMACDLFRVFTKIGAGRVLA